MCFFFRYVEHGGLDTVAARRPCGPLTTLTVNLKDTIVASPSSHLSTNVGGEFVILSLVDEVYYGLDAVGARTWELIQEPRTLGELVDIIVAEYDVVRDECREDIEALMAELSDRSLVQVIRASE